MKHNHTDKNVFFISDTHFGHGNIIRYCNRPWNVGKNDKTGEIEIDDNCIEEMNEAMISNWNSTVSEKDIIWHLGDFCVGFKNQKHKYDETRRIAERLNGNKKIVLGNHDIRNNVKFYIDCGFTEVIEYGKQLIMDDFIILSHEPLEFLNRNSPFFNIHGHVHDSTVYSTFTEQSACVCVERHDYAPVSYDMIKSKIKEMKT